MLQYFLLLGTCAAISTTVPLHNAAKPGLEMPVVGLGTGYYLKVTERTIEDSVKTWLEIGGKRIDGAVTYKEQAGVGKGIAKAAKHVSRKDIFITSKIGPTAPLGYNQTMEQWNEVKKQLGTDYVDLLLIHWPANEFSTEPTPDCAVGQPTYKLCRQETWKALLDLFHNGSALAVGVSNFETEHLMDLEEMNTLMPAVNQIETNIYWNEPELRRYCQSRNITINGYAPLGTPDYMKKKWKLPCLDHPTVTAIAKKLDKSPAQVLLRWQTQQNIVVNPRSKKREHMQENLEIFDFSLAEEYIYALNNVAAPPKDEPYKVCPNPMNLS